MYSVTQGGLDLQQVTGTRFHSSRSPQKSAFIPETRGLSSPAACGSDFKDGADQSGGLEEGLCVSKFTQSIIWCEALETTAERKSAAIVLPCRNSHNPPRNTMPCTAAALPSLFLDLPSSLAPESVWLQEYSCPDGNSEATLD